MASITKEILLDAAPGSVWDALRDVGAIHTRLAKGLVTNTTLDGESRLVTFANGAVVKELIVDVSDQARRIAYAIVGWQATHHNASFQVFPEGAGSRVVWITDVLPHDLSSLIDGLMDQGAAAIKRTLDS
jgi:carbon monoxide dehydrogenase subunit G